MAIYMQDKIDIREELDLALHMEDRGFSEIWQGDTAWPAIASLR